MFSKLVKKLFKETTNVRDISPVTFNSPGTYNPRYGKAKVTFVGKAGAGTYSPGSYVPSTENGYWNTSNLNPSYMNSPNLINVYMSGISATGESYVTDATNGAWVSNFFATGTMPAVSGYGATSVTGGWTMNSFGGLVSTSSNYIVVFDGTGHSTINFSPASSYATNANGYFKQYISVNTASAIGVVITPAADGFANAQTWNTSTFVSTGYNTAYTNSPTTTTGPSYTFDGVSVPGGYGTAATPITPTSLPYKDLWISRDLTIPSGGYATISFSI